MAEHNGKIATAQRLRIRRVRDVRLVAGVRRGDRRAFESVYERHAPELLAFCICLVGSRSDAEDALQATFTSAYRALVRDSRPVALRPWLFTIARNECLSILRRRRTHQELNGEVALTGDPVHRAELREEIGDMLEGIRELPEKQRAALVLAEVHGMSQGQIGSMMGVRADQVKAYIYQARSNLISEKHAREADCREIREELSSARGMARMRVRLRRHLRSCDACRLYAEDVRGQQRQLAALMPILPSLALRYHVLEEALRLGGADPAAAGNSAMTAGAAVEVAGGGVTALVVKVAAGLAAVGASAGVGVSALEAPPAPSTSRASAPSSHASTQLLAYTGSRGRRNSAGSVRAVNGVITAWEGPASGRAGGGYARTGGGARGGYGPAGRSNASVSGESRTGSTREPVARPGREAAPSQLSSTVKSAATHSEHTSSTKPPHVPESEEQATQEQAEKQLAYSQRAREREERRLARAERQHKGGGAASRGGGGSSGSKGHEKESEKTRGQEEEETVGASGGPHKRHRQHKEHKHHSRRHTSTEGEAG